MTAVTASISTSVDGYVAGPNDSPNNALGDGGERLHEWIYDLKSWREAHDLEGGESNQDDQIMEEVTETVGAVVMGRRMFSNDDGPWGDDPFEGHWGANPPFGVPVFVLTHHPRDPLVMDGGTTFTFVTDGLESAVAQAKVAAGDANVSVAGGASTIQQCLEAGLLDELQIHLVPVVLGDGIRLFGRSDSERIELEHTRVVDSPDVTHLRYRVSR